MPLPQRMKALYRSLSERVEQRPKHEQWVVVVISALLIGLSGLFIPLQHSPSTLIRVLLTIATVASTVLAIVFSVTFVGFQQVTSSYAERAAEALTQDSQFRITFALFGGVIAIPFTSILFTPSLPTILPLSTGALYTGAVTTSLSLAVVAGAALFVYVEQIFQRAAPGELIDLQLRTKLSPSRMFHDYPTVESLKSEVTHPLQSLYSSLMNALRNQQPTTAIQNISGIEKATLRVYEQVSTADIEDDPAEYVTAFTEPVVGGFTKTILVEANQQDAQNVTRRMCDAVESMGEAAVDREFGETIPPSIKSLGEAIVESEAGGENRYVTLFAGETAIELAKYSFRQCDAELVIKTLYPLSHPYTILLRRGVDAYHFKRRLSDFCRRDYPELFEIAVEEYGKTLPEDAPERDPTAITHGSEIEAIVLDDVIEERASLDETIRNYRRRYSESPRENSPSFDGWYNMIRTALEMGLPGLGTRVGVTVLAQAYELEKLTGERPNMFVDTLARIQLNHSSGGEVITSVFHYATTEEPPNYARPTHSSRVSTDTVDGGLIERLQNIMGDNEGDQTPFESWISGIEQEVTERREYLEENYDWDYSPWHRDRDYLDVDDGERTSRRRHGGWRR